LPYSWKAKQTQPLATKQFFSLKARQDGALDQVFLMMDSWNVKDLDRMP